MMCRNYHHITLLNCAFMVLSNIFPSRVIPYANEIVCEYQHGWNNGPNVLDT